jgi:hypothetical protein
VEAQQQVFEEHMAEFAELASEWLDVQERLNALPKGALSERDQKKLSALQGSFHQQLTIYKMGSLDVAGVKISPGSYEPEVAGVNLSADVSASELIRLHWAYLLGLLEVGTQKTGNHPGLLIFDEPQHQSVEETAFREMLRHAAGEKNCQILITTSHDRAIGAYLKQIGVTHLAEFGDDRILQRLLRQRFARELTAECQQVIRAVDERSYVLTCELCGNAKTTWRTATGKLQHANWNYFCDKRDRIVDSGGL